MKNVRPIDAVYLRRKVVQMHDRLQQKSNDGSSSAVLAALEAVQSLIDKTATLESEPKKPRATCDGCLWKGANRTKCACCRRNYSMKDNFEPGGVHIGGEVHP